jgi:hypothetical protein
MAGIGDAWGLREKNNGSLSRDSASAEVFCTPGRCRAVSEISSTAVTNANVRRRLESAGSLAAPLFTAATTDMLSQRQRTRFPAQ